MITMLPQRGIVRSPLYLPPEHEIPDGDAGLMGFDFPATIAAGTNEFSVQAIDDFLVTHIVAFSDAAYGGFSAQILHQHGTQQRQLLANQTYAGNLAGSAKAPLILRAPYLVAKGDALTVAIANTANDGTAAANFVSANIQVAVWGVYLRRQS
jgi:hypothetical protein